MRAAWTVNLSMLSERAISPLPVMASAVKSSASSAFSCIFSFPFRCMTFMYSTPPTLADTKPMAATVRPKLEPLTKP